jgi:hypothetical protein
MTDLFWLSRAQLERIEPYFPVSHGWKRTSSCQPYQGYRIWGWAN